MHNYPTHVLANWATRLDEFAKKLANRPQGLNNDECDQLTMAITRREQIDAELEARVPDLEEVNPEIF